MYILTQSFVYVKIEFIFLSLVVIKNLDVLDYGLILVVFYRTVTEVLPNGVLVGVIGRIDGVIVVEVKLCCPKGAAQ